MQGASYSGIAAGNISPCRFVKKTSTLGEPTITQAGAGDDVYGISQPSTRKAPLAGLDDGFAAIAGETLNVFGPGDDGALLEIAATVTAGQLLKSDANGAGIVAATDKDRACARAKHGGVSGDKIAVQPLRFDLSI